MKKIIIILMSVLGLSSCSGVLQEPIHNALNVPFTSNSKTQYQDSKNAPDLVVDAPLTTTNLSSFYHLPPPPKDPKVNILPPVT